MKRIILAAAVAACANFTPAQAADIPKAQCDPKPEYPGHLAMQSETRRASFKRDIDRYRTCVNKYVDDHKAAMKSEEEAINSAITDYNDTMKKIDADQKAAAERNN
ncbi:MAG TPA: hypothetical protein VLT89_17370 [Usitatibacter sp.]|nr:hypothetical protein [Usitatibacter sp.]